MTQWVEEQRGLLEAAARKLQEEHRAVPVGCATDDRRRDRASKQASKQAKTNEKEQCRWNSRDALSPLRDWKPAALRLQLAQRRTQSSGSSKRDRKKGRDSPNASLVCEKKICPLNAALALARYWFCKEIRLRQREQRQNVVAVSASTAQSCPYYLVSLFGSHQITSCPDIFSCPLAENSAAF